MTVRARPSRSDVKAKFDDFDCDCVIGLARGFYALIRQVGTALHAATLELIVAGSR